MNQKDQQIIDGILKGGLSEEQQLRRLYKENLASIKAFILTNNGNEADANDVFQDALVVLYRQIKQKKFRGESSIKTYLYAICKNLWYQKLKREKRAMEIYEQVPQQILEDPYLRLQKDERLKFIFEILDELGESCKKMLLKALYYQFSMEEIAEQMEFKNAQNARNKKYKCLKSLQNLIANKPEIKNLIQELR